MRKIPKKPQDSFIWKMNTPVFIPGCIHADINQPLMGSLHTIFLSKVEGFCHLSYYAIPNQDAIMDTKCIGDCVRLFLVP